MPDVLLIEESSGTRIMGRREYSSVEAVVTGVEYTVCLVQILVGLGY